MSSDFNWHKAQDVAERLGVTPETVRRWYRDGELRGTRFGWRTLRFTEEDVAEFERTRARASDAA